MNYKEAIRMVKQGFKVYRANWNNAYICLSAYPMFYTTDGYWDSDLVK